MTNGATLDLATAHPDTDEVTVLSGDGTGMFVALGTHAVGDQPVAIVAAQLDGTEGTDMAVLNQGSADVSVLLGGGDGSLSPETRYAAGVDLPRDLASGDFNVDGHVDLAVAGRGDPAFAILHGDGLGSFARAVGVAVPETVRHIRVADLDGDGWGDVVLATDWGFVTILRGGEHGLGSPEQYVAGARGPAVVGEFNRDGLLDLVVADQFAPPTLLLNRLDVPILFDSPETLRWRRLVGYDRFNVYRGDLSDLRSDTPTWGTCRNASDPDLTDNVLMDGEAPAQDAGLFYLMSRVPTALRPISAQPVPEHPGCQPFPADSQCPASAACRSRRVAQSGR